MLQNQGLLEVKPKMPPPQKKEETCIQISSSVSFLPSGMTILNKKYTNKIKGTLKCSLIHKRLPQQVACWIWQIFTLDDLPCSALKKSVSTPQIKPRIFNLFGKFVKQ